MADKGKESPVRYGCDDSLKIMGPENAPDADPRKTFRLIECREAEFYRDDDGNAYLMNESGKTVASFGSARLGCKTYDWPEVGEASVSVDSEDIAA